MVYKTPVLFDLNLQLTCVGPSLRCLATHYDSYRLLPAHALSQLPLASGLNLAPVPPALSSRATVSPSYERHILVCRAAKLCELVSGTRGRVRGAGQQFSTSGRRQNVLSSLLPIPLRSQKPNQTFSLSSRL